MKFLEIGETYNIESLDDLWNCPINMIDETIKAIRDIYLTRLKKIEELGKDIKVVNSYFYIVNDGDDNTYIKFRGVEKKDEKKLI